MRAKPLEGRYVLLKYLSCTHPTSKLPLEAPTHPGGHRPTGYGLLLALGQARLHGQARIDL